MSKKNKGRVGAARVPTSTRPVQPDKPAIRFPILLLFYGIIALICIAIYGRNANFACTNLDDTVIVYDLSCHHYTIRDALVSDAYMKPKGTDFYRPLQSITFLFDNAVGKASTVSYHLTSLAIHIFSACCLLYLLFLFGFDRLRLLFASLIFAASPLFTQAIAWVPGRGDLLLALCGLLAMIALVKLRQTGQRRYILGHGVAFFLAVLSKETALLLLPLFGAYLLLFDRRAWLAPKYRLLAPVWAVAVVAYFAFRHVAIGRMSGSEHFGIIPLLNNLRVLPETLAYFFIPYNVPVLPSFSPVITGGGLFIGFALVLLLILRKKIARPIVVLGALWFVLLSVPGMMYSHTHGSFDYDYLVHRTYLPIIGVLLVLVESVPASRNGSGRIRFSVLSSVVVAVLGFLAFRQAGAFAGPAVFDDFAVLTNPRSSMTWLMRGELKADKGDNASAIADFNNALKVSPTYPYALNDRANSRGKLGDIQGAIADLTGAVRSDSNYSLAWSNLGRWKAQVGDIPGALEAYGRSIRIDPTYPGVFNNRGALYAQRHDLEHAVADFQAALRIDSQFTDALVNLGRTKLETGDTAGACGFWRKAKRMGNTDASGLVANYCK